MRIDPDEVKFDLELTRRNFDYDEALLREIGNIFVEDVPILVKRLIDLRLDIVHADERSGEDGPACAPMGEVKRVAHSIKGLAATFGAQPLVTIAQEIENEPATSLGITSAEKVQRLSDVAKRTVEELAAQLEQSRLRSSPS